MPQKRQGAFRLFQVAGIEVFLHWAWFVLAFYEFQERRAAYSSPVFCAAEYLGLFLIVLLHEFGHAFACRSVGGKANTILLWPFGGVAFVDPPQRPGPILWSIAAGPLVNVALAPALYLLVFASRSTGLAAAMPDADELLRSLAIINTGLLVFNVLPIYPLDGGQILRAVLWFLLGRARSLKIAVGVGFAGVAGIVAFAVSMHSGWMGFIALFVLSRCLLGWKEAQALSKLAAIPRRAGFACPACRTPPPLGECWTCQHCQIRFDLFLHHGACHNCRATYSTVQCLDCGSAHQFEEWIEPDERSAAIG